MNKKINKTKRHKTKHESFHEKLVAFGTNPAGARSKWSTWEEVIRETGATIWFMQETKCPTKQFKMENFVVYERVRERKNGGDVAIAAVKDLNPVLVSESTQKVEAITIEIHPKKFTIVCTSAYRPQNNDNKENKSKFWEYLDCVAETARNVGKGFLLQGDLNARLGPSII